MNSKYVIADVCRCFTGTVTETLHRVEEFALREGVHVEDISVVGRHDQSELVVPAGWKEHRCNRWEAATAVTNLLSALPSDPAASAFLLSYDHNVLSLAAAPSKGLALQATAFSELRLRRPRVSTPVAWRFGHIVSEDDALNVMITVLERKSSFSRDSGSRSASLRPAMTMIDARFEGGAFATNTAGMISALVRIAEAKELVDVDWTVAVNPFVWLRSQIARKSSIPTANAMSQSDVALAEQASIPDPLMQHRSRRLEALLKAEGMGPYAVGRLAMFRAIEAAIDQKAESTVDSLVSIAEQEARGLVDNAGFDSTKQPWKKISNLVARLLTESGSVLDADGKAIPPGWSSKLAKVCGLAENWIAMADAQIILALITVSDDVSEDDATDLAGLLYHCRDEVSRAKVFQAVAHLFNAKLVKEDFRNGHRYLVSIDCQLDNKFRPKLVERTVSQVSRLTIAK